MGLLCIAAMQQRLIRRHLNIVRVSLISLTGAYELEKNNLMDYTLLYARLKLKSPIAIILLISSRVEYSSGGKAHLKRMTRLGGDGECKRMINRSS